MAAEGVVTKLERVRRANNWFDTLYNPGAVAHWVGVRLMPGQQPPRITLSHRQQQKR